MRLALAIALGLAGGIGVAWWASRGAPSRDAGEPAAASAARAGQVRVEDARLRLYRWRDDAGNLQVTEQPPKGRSYEAVDRLPREGIEVHGDRE